jgi:hypothetical protein
VLIDAPLKVLASLIGLGFFASKWWTPAAPTAPVARQLFRTLRRISSGNHHGAASQNVDSV